MTKIDDYFSNATAPQKAEFDKIRKLVHASAPDVEETISYGLPTFKVNGHPLLYFGVFKNHMSIFPGAPLALKEKFKDFKLAKGTIQFTADHPIPEHLINEILRLRLSEIPK